MTVWTSKKQDSKQGAELLLDVAQRLFMEDGYAHVSMQQIAEEAGMTKGAPYYHFQNKEDLFTKVSIQILRELKERINDACSNEGTLEQRLNRVIVTVVNSMTGNLEQWFADFYRKHSHDQAIAALREALEIEDITQLLNPLFAEAVAQGEITRVSADDASRVFISLMMMKVKDQTYRQLMGSGRPGEMEHATAVLVDIFLHGVS